MENEFSTTTQYFFQLGFRMNSATCLTTCPSFLKEKRWDRRTELTCCIWIFIYIHLTDFQIIFHVLLLLTDQGGYGHTKLPKKSIKTSPWLLVQGLHLPITCHIPPFSVVTTDSAFLLLFYTKRRCHLENICYRVSLGIFSFCKKWDLAVELITPEAQGHGLCCLFVEAYGLLVLNFWSATLRLLQSWWNKLRS